MLIIVLILLLGEVRDGRVYIGDASAALSSHRAAAMVPNVLFYDNDLVRDLFLSDSLEWPLT